MKLLEDSTRLFITVKTANEQHSNQSLIKDFG
jgi:hypothetical protein